MRLIREAFLKDHPLFIPFIMAGHPTLEITTQAVLTLIDAGADIIELGIPFSDPIADGPINQRAAEIGLKNGTTLASVLELVQHLRKNNCTIPIIFNGYLNPILAMGIEKFAHSASFVGVNGVIVDDLPPEEGAEFYRIMNNHGIVPILLSSPTTCLERLKLFADIEPGFIYVISRLGVTGTQSDVKHELKENILRIREAIPNIPLAVGFGISNEAQAAEVASYSDGVIVGSYLVNELEKNGIEGFRKVALSLSSAIKKLKI